MNRRDLLKLTGLTASSISLNAFSGSHNKITTPINHHKATAKNIIYLCQSGGPSHVDLFDYHPELYKLHGSELPNSVRNGQRVTGMSANQKSFPVCAPIKPFQQHGQTGTWMSDLLPHTSKIVDDICIIKSMHTEAINHDPGVTFLNTGSQFPGHPSLGAWVSYGLGSKNKNMPAFCTLISQGSGKNPGQPIFSRLWGSGFLPSVHQGVQLRSSSSPILFLQDPRNITRKNRRLMLSALKELNLEYYQKQKDEEALTRIEQYEMSYRMQKEAPQVVDISNEPESTFKLYGEDARKPGTYAFNCLLARRMIEKDIRMVQLFHRGWDQHKQLKTHLPAQCKDTDQASAALITDLKQRGLLDDTLVVWSGEFGRSVYSQGKLGSGRDHHGRCFSMWMAGGGTKAGMSYGQTDEFAYNVVDKPVSVNDLNATILHCLGIDHERFSVKHQGLDTRLTGVEHCSVIKDLLT
ncbi:MAG: DUF1501 domain-containing protein [Lentisphaeraceae bacterium]|nr:DUF1501 domain-containing protein [Lentisphaeraceae bacterium]